ncbi:DUF5666 domain-containing protein [Leifsonia sp. AG29]|uniref:DUF5666 domain-containing protein n=1 Tax=Leifsonia sp. AG29 TaxID=2598860 RepID=UPI00131DFF64|nr:DUF5666 domain-containing protein [Leifsonia sp. AG29]
MQDQQPTEPLPPHGVAPGPTIIAEPFYKRHGLAFAISTLVLSLVLLLGLAGAGTFAVVSAVTHLGERGISRVIPGAPGQGLPGHQRGMPGAPGSGEPGGGQGGGQAKAGRIVEGAITSLSGSSWTIDTFNGATLSVTVTSSTVFGHPGATEKKSDFAVGDEVVVVGVRSGGAFTATRILKLSDLPLRTPKPSPSATP